MNDLISQFSNLKIAKFRVCLQAQTEAVLPALIGSTLRGAFGHALKAISCCVPHKNCEICILSEACLYTTVFEPVSAKNQDIPRPFIFEPPIPPITRELSETSNLKLRVNEGGKISFDFILIGDTISKLPYFIYAFELLARHGLGLERQPFKIVEVLAIYNNNQISRIYLPSHTKILSYPLFDLGLYVKNQLLKFSKNNTLPLSLLTPLRIRRNKRLIEKLTFLDFYKQCSLRLKFIFENYGIPLEYDYLSLLKIAESVKFHTDNTWVHNSERRSNRQNKQIDLNGFLGEAEFIRNDLFELLPVIFACEVLHIGSNANLGLGKFSVLI
jgi:hypothetical protein